MASSAKKHHKTNLLSTTQSVNDEARAKMRDCTSHSHTKYHVMKSPHHSTVEEMHGIGNISGTGTESDIMTIGKDRT